MMFEDAIIGEGIMLSAFARTSMVQPSPTLPLY